jgi:hypothetical protein
MISWIYLIAQFTPEALLIESFLMCTLLGAYAAFWILKKRRYGAIDTQLPSAPVKIYLNELIFHAEQLRSQLFGLHSQTEAPHPPLQAPLPAATSSALAPSTEAPVGLSADANAQIQLLQTKMSEQEKQISNLNKQKIELEKKATEALQAAAKANGAGPSPVELQAKLKDVESKLQEYSIIEDDLINLRKYTLENTRLKALLGDKANDLGPNAQVEPDPKSAEVIEAMLQSAQNPPTSPTEATPPLSSNPPESTQTTPEAPAEAPKEGAQTTTPPQEAAAATPTSTDPSPAAPPASGDIVDEFEKMLNG